MGEAIITSRYGQPAEGDSGSVMQLPNYTSLVVSVKDSAGRRIKYAGVQVIYPNNAAYTGWCNEKGQGLFFIPSNISEVNVRALNRFKDDSNAGFLADQNNIYLNNIQTNIGGIVYANCQLSYKSTGSICTMSGNYKFLDTNYADVYVIGAGGGGLSGSRQEYGGGGGALNMAKNISINKSKLYSFIIGAGGTRGIYRANSGGTSSAFGLSANGGNGANSSINGANGGIGMYNGGEGGYRNMTGDNQFLNYNGANSNYIGKLLAIGSVLDGINAGTSDPYGDYNQTWTRYVNFANIGHGGAAATTYNDYRGTYREYSFGSGGHGNQTYTSSGGVDGVIFLANFR